MSFHLFPNFADKILIFPSTCSRLTMPHDERILKSAFKTYGKTNPMSGNAPIMSKRGTNLSQTPYVNKTFDMKGQVGGFSSAQMSPELDRHGDIDDRYKKA